MKTYHALKAMLGGSFLALGCSTAPEPSVTLNEPTLHTAAVTTAQVGAAGYVHAASASKFHLGANTSVRVEFGLRKMVGDEGVIATDPVTGAVRAILNGDSPAADIPALTSDADVHNGRVLQYFESAGIPKDQLGPPHVLTLMESHGPSSTPENQRTPKFAAYTTVLTRVVQGVPVPDSFAAARFNSNDETTMEWVYWPPIPKSVIDDAVMLQTMTAAPTALAAYRTKLPSELGSATGSVNIRHSDFADPNFVAFASYDVIDGVRPGRARAGNRCFDINGKEVIHPNRRPNDVPVASSVSKK